MYFLLCGFMPSLCSVPIHVCVNNFSKSTKLREIMFLLNDTLSIEDEKLFKACKSVCSSDPQSHYNEVPPPTL